MLITDSTSQKALLLALAGESQGGFLREDVLGHEFPVHMIHPMFQTYLYSQLN